MLPFVVSLSASSVCVASPLAIALGAPLAVLPGVAGCGAKSIDVVGRSVILVDEVIAGTHALEVVRSLRRERPRRIVVASPVAELRAVEQLLREADDVVHLVKSLRSCAAEQFYAAFPAPSREEVRALLARSA